MRGIIRDVLFPGRCLLCGEWLLFSGGRGWPVCGQCKDGLAPIQEPRCRICSTPLVSEQGVCTRCREATYAFSANHSLFANSGPVKELISCLKFSGRRRLAIFFAELLAGAIRTLFPGIPVVPVPPRPGRARQDPVSRVAGALERLHGCVVLPLLSRTGGATQKSLDFEHRRTNLQGRVRMLPGRTVSVPVLLLDDIFTTGATADACARVLRESGCQEVNVISIAMET